MKKIILCIAIFFFTGNVYSQALEKVHFGIRVGVAVASSKFIYLTNNPDYKYSAKPGVLVGGFADIPISKMLVFQPALLYVRKGMKEIQSYYSYNISNNYFEIPLNLLFMPTGKLSVIYFGAGVSPAFATAGYYRIVPLKKFDFGVNVLAGYKLPIGLSVNLNYTYGVLNLINYKDIVSSARNRYLGISLGYFF